MNTLKIQLRANTMPTIPNIIDLKLDGEYIALNMYLMPLQPPFMITYPADLSSGEHTLTLDFKNPSAEDINNNGTFSDPVDLVSNVILQMLVYVTAEGSNNRIFIPALSQVLSNQIVTFGETATFKFTV